MGQRAIACFERALEVANAEDARLREVLRGYFAWVTTTSMVASPQNANDVPNGLRITHWTWEALETD